MTDTNGEPHMTARAHYELVSGESTAERLVIRDVGDDNEPSVTNDAAAVVAELFDLELLPPGRALLYYDSCGSLDEIVVEGGAFAGFRVGPR